MKFIDLETYPRRRILEAFATCEVPCLSVTNLVDITGVKTVCEQAGCSFFVGMTFLISKAVNRVPELRHRLIEGKLVEFERVDPGYTVLLKDRTFSFCDSRHYEDFPSYRDHAEICIDLVKQCPDLGTGEKHHMFFITNLPWFSFTAITHPYQKRYASIPVISLGQYVAQGERILIPIAIQVNHALVDGIHLGDFYAHLSSMCHAPGRYVVP